MQSAQGTIDLAEALPTLAKSRKAMDKLMKEVGVDHVDEAAAMMKAASLTGALGDQMHDFFADEIANGAETVWQSEIHGGEFSVEVIEFCGLFFVWAPDYDRVGYFMSLAAAKGYAYSNWDSLENASTPPAPLWAKQEKALHKKLRDSGRTVVVAEPADSATLTVTFPMGRRPVKK